MESKLSDFSGYLAVLQRRRLVLLSVVLPMIISGLALAIGLPNKYQSLALFRFERSVMSDYIGGLGTGSGYVDQYISSLSDSVLGDDSLLRMAEEAKVVSAEQSPSDRVKALRRAINVKMISEKILDPRDGRDRPIYSSFSVGFSGRDPAESQRVAEWLANEYVKVGRTTSIRQTSTSTGVLVAESDKLRDRISDLEAALAKFKAKNFRQLPELASSNVASIERAEAELQTIEAQIASLRRERATLIGQLRQVDDPAASQLQQLEDDYRKASAIYDANHPDVVALRRQIESINRGAGRRGNSLQEQLANQQAVLTESLQRYSADHPDVKRIQREIVTLQARIAAGETVPANRPNTSAGVQVQGQITAVDSQLGSLLARGAELRSKLRQTEISVEATPEVERGYQSLTRDLATAREKYAALLKQQMDAEVAGAAVVAGGRDEFHMVQAPAKPLKPTSPARGAIVILALLLALMIGFLATTAAELLDGSVRGGRDVQHLLGVMALAAIPTIDTPELAGMRRRKFIYVAAVSCVVAVVVLGTVRKVLW